MQKKGTVLLAWPAVAGCSRAETFSQLSSISFAQPCICRTCNICSCPSRFHTCFGWFNFWDWYYQTDAQFERSPVHKERHVVLKDLRSARELVPDEKYKNINNDNNNN